MGVLDKIKNALFEVEYVEVEDPPKKGKKIKRDKKETVEEKPIAKKIILPEAKKTRVEDLHEEELVDEDFEIRPREESLKQRTHEDFKMMNDDDFMVEEEIQQGPSSSRDFSVKDDFEQEKQEEKDVFSKERQEDYYKSDFQNERNSDFDRSSHSYHESKLYGRNSSYDVPVHEYGTYEKKEERVYFRPSPIISPIYGILDKNYRKEDVREKKEVRITSSYTRSNVSVDDIRNKAYGEKKVNVDKPQTDSSAVDDTKFEVEEDDNLLVDLSNSNKKPEVKELTVGDAMEYFQDLGLEYNVDYVDVSKKNTNQKKVQNNGSEGNANPLEKDIMETNLKDDVSSASRKTVEVKHGDKSLSEDVSSTENDNLFDLIDSMYQEND